MSPWTASGEGALALDSQPTSSRGSRAARGVDGAWPMENGSLALRAGGGANRSTASRAQSSSSGGKLKKVSTLGGVPIEICDAYTEGPGGSWVIDDTIWFSGNWNSGFLEVPDRRRKARAGHGSGC